MSVTTPNMGLIESTIAVDTGLSWEQNLNASLDIVDGHDHTPGSGVPITPTAININADLPFTSHNATQLRSVRFTAQGSPISAVSPDLGCLYESGVDLYYNDGSGNQVRLTQSGSVAGTPGSISGLVSPASASYIPISKTFVFQSDVSTPANIDVGGVTLRNITASSNGITIAPATSLANNYSITLPVSNPTQYSVLQTTSSGASVWMQSYNAIVGSASQVTNGSATHSTLSAALSAASADWSILVLQGAWTESITISTRVRIQGSGYNSVFTGNLSFAGVSYAVLNGIRITGNFSIDSSSSGNRVANCYIGASSTATDAGTGNFINDLTQG